MPPGSASASIRAAILQDDVADIDADTEIHAPLGRNFEICLVERALDGHRAIDRLDAAGEVGDDAVAGAADDLAAMLGDQLIDDGAVGGERR